MANKIDGVELTQINVDTARKIWEIAKLSSDYGNALVDVLGDEVYSRVMKIQGVSDDKIE